MKFHCNYCHKEFIYKVDLANSTVSICCRPECPAYGLLQIPAENLPKPKKSSSSNPALGKPRAGLKERVKEVKNNEISSKNI